MFGARGLLLASGRVEQEEWNVYVRRIKGGDRAAGLQALGFAKYVRSGERKAYSQ
jgi:hypothetical protein